MEHIMKVSSGIVGPKRGTLRARGIAPRPNYVIRPAAGSLVGDVPSLRDDRDRTNEVVARLLASSGANRTDRSK